jgi:hypothetical protein
MSSTLKGAAQVMKHLKMPGESLSDIKGQWDALTDADKAELIESGIREGIVKAPA